jgi:hypothetical protein
MIQSSFKLKRILSKDYIFPVGSAVLIAIAFLNKDNAHFNSGAFLGLGCAGLGLFSQLSRIKLRAFELGAVLTIVFLFVLASITTGNHPQLSSISFISALVLLFGIMAAISLARFQVFFYGKGQQGIIPYADSGYWGEGGGFPAARDSSIGHNWNSYDGWGDCGGDGGGNCGG